MVGEVRRALEDAGRDPMSFQLINYGSKTDPELIEMLMRLDFSEAVFAVDSLAPNQVIEELDEISEFVEQYR